MTWFVILWLLLTYRNIESSMTALRGQRFRINSNKVFGTCMAWVSAWYSTFWLGRDGKGSWKLRSRALHSPTGRFPTFSRLGQLVAIWRALEIFSCATRTEAIQYGGHPNCVSNGVRGVRYDIAADQLFSVGICLAKTTTSICILHLVL